MSAKGEVYMLRSESEQTNAETDWIRPEPASRVIRDAIDREADIDMADVKPLWEYVDRDELAALFKRPHDEPQELTFSVESYEVTVGTSGEIDVSQQQ
jgi:hypothetical protein